jgi:hypothetical protein
MAHSTATKRIKSNVILQNEPGAEDRKEDQDFSIADNPIHEAPEMIRFASIRQIANMTFIPHATVLRRLTELCHIDLKRLHCLPTDSRIVRNRLTSSSQRSC